MTAEIAIANGYGVALAADSAITHTGKNKTYNSGEKLFALSDHSPVGIMMYGNTRLLGVPWETIIQTCRKELGDEQFDTLEEYADYLINYIDRKTEYFSQESQEEWLDHKIHHYFLSLHSTIEEDLERYREMGDEDCDDNKDQMLEMLVNEQHEELVNALFCDDADEEFEKELKAKYANLFENLVNEVFNEYELKAHTSDKLKELAALVITRSHFTDFTSGIVIAGFGGKEIFPTVVSLKVEGLIDGMLKYIVDDEKSDKILNGRSYIINAYAQEDVVDAFINGMDDSAFGFIDQYLSNLLDGFTAHIPDDKLKGTTKEKKQMRSDLSDLANELHAEFMANLNIFLNENHIKPVLEMVPSLPKDELAEMAESLVNLTAFKRHMTESNATVGGPIDVAVVSKGDGMVWVKKKEYYSKDLN